MVKETFAKVSESQDQAKLTPELEAELDAFTDSLRERGVCFSLVVCDEKRGTVAWGRLSLEQRQNVTKHLRRDIETMYAAINAKEKPNGKANNEW